jgi:hypothetical protein
MGCNNRFENSTADSFSSWWVLARARMPLMAVAVGRILVPARKNTIVVAVHFMVDG